MAQLGSGNDSSYPGAIDTRQFFQNVAAAVPDSSTRLDAEAINDMLSAILAIETALGSNPQGNYGSLSARLNQFIPGGGSGSGGVSFTSVLQVHVGGTQLVPTVPAVLYRAYSEAIPAVSLDPGTVIVSVDQLNYTLQVFFAQTQSGFLVTNSGAPQYVTSFSNLTTLTVPGSTHGLATAGLLWQLYDDQVPAHAITPGTLSVHRTTFDVTITFNQPQSGTLVLSHVAPNYVHAFVNVTSTTIAGVTHQLGTRALLYQLYDAATPALNAIEALVSVHPITFDVTVTFGQPQSGFLVLASASTLTGSDFDIRDAGIPDNTAVRVRSDDGNLRLQAGGGNQILFLERTGQVVKMLLDTLTGNLSLLGAETPGIWQLYLATDWAFKQDTSTWFTLSDARLKEDMRPFTDGLDLLMQLAPQWYRRRGPSDARHRPEHVGLMAQDVQALAPYMVREHQAPLTPGGPEEPILALNMHHMWFVLINSVQELTKRVIELETQVEMLVEARRNADRSLW